MLSSFRVISMVEGISLLLLLFVAMPIKYGLGYPLAVTLAGWAHGLLFMLYVYQAMSLSQRLNWPQSTLATVIFLGFVPFGCFFLNNRLKRLAPQTVTEKG